jgi:UDP-N-acetylglucosamine--N-acetylmuramyl-(pentapeptide) pyrophosphoryl-undecaprenol N-acetylglucosamine transferase
MLNKPNRILITGGHATPAIACIEELKSRGYSNFIYIGQKKSILFDKNTSSEYKLVTEKLNLPFKSILAGKLSLLPNFSSFIWFLRIPIGFIQAFWWLLISKPSLVLTFGSHVALPIVFWAYILRIPIVAHEQTLILGRANRFIQKLATKVCLSWPSKEEITNYELRMKNEGKYVLTGNPVRKEILEANKELFEFGNKKRETIFITGGNQGAHIINEFIFGNLAKLLTKFNIIHQTGSNSLFNDFDKANSLAEKFNQNNICYIPKNYVFAEEMASAYKQSAVLISRAGANTITECLVLKKKAILIPLPNSSGNEQYLNGKMLESLGLGLVIEQKDLGQIDLVQKIEELEKTSFNEVEVAKQAKIHLEAEKNVSNIVESLLTTKV